VASTPIDAAFVINLDRRPDRLRDFCQRYPRELPPPERFAAVDGHTLAPAGAQFRGRWGCWNSHVGVLDLCCKRGLDSALIFEDDAHPIAGCGRLWPEVLDAVPADWQIVWLGGRILGSCRRVNRYVAALHSAVVLHAYLVRQPLMGEIVARLGFDPVDGPGDNHVDNIIADLVAGRPGVYGSIPWLFLHGGAGRSDISGAYYSEPFTWPHAGELSLEGRFVPREQPCDADADGYCKRSRCGGRHRKVCLVGAGLVRNEVID